jgi:hypothetical protein
MTEPTWTSPLESVATAYAAIVATAALGLELHRRFTEGPKLDVSLIPDGVATGDGPSDEEDILIAEVMIRFQRAAYLAEIEAKGGP